MQPPWANMANKSKSSNKGRRPSQMQRIRAELLEDKRRAQNRRTSRVGRLVAELVERPTVDEATPKSKPFDTWLQENNAVSADAPTVSAETQQRQRRFSRRASSLVEAAMAAVAAGPTADKSAQVQGPPRDAPKAKVFDEWVQESAAPGTAAAGESASN